MGGMGKRTSGLTGGLPFSATGRVGAGCPTLQLARVVGTCDAHTGKDRPRAISSNRRLYWRRSSPMSPRCPA